MEKNETAFYFRIPVDCELKENEVFALSSHYPRAIRPNLIMFYFGGAYTVLSKIVPIHLSVYARMCVVYVCVVWCGVVCVCVWCDVCVCGVCVFVCGV